MPTDLDDRVATIETTLSTLVTDVALLKASATPPAPVDGDLTNRVTKLEVEVFPPVAPSNPIA